MRWLAGSDHAGLALKCELIALLREWGDTVEDLGTDSSESVDYPDYGRAVAERVVAEGALGLLVCGTGNGIAMSANKVAQARAALATDAFTARMARMHNDANLIVFGARVVGVGVAGDALKAFRDASFEGGRHQKRVDKMMAIGKTEGS
ncbi:MAG: ribose 5-phosphate isomerase B [Kofleriaceae bacterium]|nr:ribose 5-phosphate isomerase B [Kofleriaceae bacterium]